MKIAFRALIVAMLVGVITGAASAQVRDPSQQKLDYLWNGPRASSAYSAQAAGVRMTYARECAQQLQTYSTVAPREQVVQAVTKVESENIGQTLSAAKKNLANVKKDAEKTSDAAVLAKIESIQKHLDAAMESHKTMDMACCKASVEGEEVTKCCDDVMTELDKALAEHASLMRLLQSKAKPTPTQK